MFQVLRLWLPIRPCERSDSDCLGLLGQFINLNEVTCSRIERKNMFKY